MTDGSARVDYGYDQLSLLRSETRQFNGLSGSFAISYDYNVAGELKTITEPSGSHADYLYDGNGFVAKTANTQQVNSNSPATTTTFFLRSTLTGNVIAEYDLNGLRQSAYVFAGTQLIAQSRKQVDGSERLMWQHINPVTGDGLTTDPQGIASDRTTVDPMSVNVGDSNPFASNEPTNGGDSEGMSQSAIDAIVASIIPGVGQSATSMEWSQDAD